MTGPHGHDATGDSGGERRHDDGATPAPPVHDAPVPAGEVPTGEVPDVPRDEAPPPEDAPLPEPTTASAPGETPVPVAEVPAAEPAAVRNEPVPVAAQPAAEEPAAEPVAVTDEPAPAIEQAVEQPNEQPAETPEPQPEQPVDATVADTGVVTPAEPPASVPPVAEPLDATGPAAHPPAEPIAEQPEPAAAPPEPAAPAAPLADEPATPEDPLPPAAPPAPAAALVADRDLPGEDVAAARSRRRAVARAALLGTAVLLVVAATVLGLRLRDAVLDERARDAALTAARQSALNLTSIDREDFEEDVARVLDGATGEFRQDFAGRVEELETLLQENEVSAEGRVLEAGIVRSDRQSATALVVVDSTVRNTAVPDGRVNSYRMKVELEKVGDLWLTSSLEFVG